MCVRINETRERNLSVVVKNMFRLFGVEVAIDLFYHVIINTDVHELKMSGLLIEYSQVF
jgi:hypothetical protein